VSRHWRRKRLSADWPEGVGRHVLTTVGSTNAHALGLAETPAWVLAHEQTAGRGRRGRAWSSPRGNFYASYVMEVRERPETIALRSFVAALALRDSCIALTGLDASFKLKWPNDVLLNGGKLSGILLESQGGGRVAIGMGVNLIHAPTPEQVEQRAVLPVSLLAETGIRVTPEAFLDRLAPAFAQREAQLQRGFDTIRGDFLDHAARVGERIVARTGTRTETGTFITIDDQGALILDLGDGRIAIPAADIFFDEG